MLTQFQKDLQRLLGEQNDLRPFVCEGSPLECKIFIVGFNPATKLKQPFWNYWQNGYGFKKSVWLRDYPKPKLTGTRPRIELFIAETTPIKCLETNIHAKASNSERQLSHQDRITEPFDFLLMRIRSSAILVHGSMAVNRVQTHFGVRLGTDTVQTVKTPWGVVRVLAAKGHLSRVSYNYTKELGRKMLKACLNK